MNGCEKPIYLFVPGKKAHREPSLKSACEFLKTSRGNINYAMKHNKSINGYYISYTSELYERIDFF